MTALAIASYNNSLKNLVHLLRQNTCMLHLHYYSIRNNNKYQDYLLHLLQIDESSRIQVSKSLSLYRVSRLVVQEAFQVFIPFGVACGYPTVLVPTKCKGTLLS